MARSPLSDDRDAFRQLGHRTVDALATFLNGVDRGPVDIPVPDDQRHMLANLPLPEDGQSAEEIIDFIIREVASYRLYIAHRRSYGWINSPPSPIGILANTAANAINSGLDGFDHGAMFLMVSLGNWLMELTGFPKEHESMALLFSGGSAANLNALTTARNAAARADGWNIRAEGLQGHRPRMIVYAADQAHSSIQRCVEQLGLGAESLRLVRTDDDFRMDPQALSRWIATDRANGLRPFCVVAAAGTTNVGAIDPLNEIADVCEREDLWFHIDGAYGGLGRLDPTYTHRYIGVSRADSLTVDPHKWMHVPIDCGALLTRRKSAHRDAYSLTPDYLEGESGSGAPWPYEYMYQLTYGDRALKTWATLARLGRTGLRDMIAGNNRVAEALGQTIEESSLLELMAPVSLSVVNFRFVPTGSGLSGVELDHLNQRISDAILKGGEAQLPTTRVRGRVALRACIVHHENDKNDMVHLAQLVEHLGKQLSQRSLK